MINAEEFEPTCPKAESLASYNPGGFFPVSINDRFQNGRYEILNKLGVGENSMVWVARDHQKEINVAIKIIKAEHSENNQELKILEYLQKEATEHPGYKYLSRLLDHFYQSGPNQRNLCLVLEMYGPNVKNVHYWLQGYQWGLSCSDISRQLLLAVDCLHAHGIVHGDIHMGSILFIDPDYYEDEDIAIVDKETVRRKDGTPIGDDVPKYLVIPIEPPNVYNNVDADDFDHLKIIGFSSAFFVKNPPKSIDTMGCTYAPELIFQQPFNNKIDIWSLACTTFFLVSGFTPVPDRGCGDGRQYIPVIHRRLGESSAHWLLTSLIDAIATKNWETDKLFDDGYKVFDPIEEFLVWGSRKDFDGSNPEGDCFIRYIRKCLVADPSQRATTQELLTEEWAQLGESDEEGSESEEDGSQSDEEGSDSKEDASEGMGRLKLGD